MDEELPAPWPEVLAEFHNLCAANDAILRVVEQIRVRHEQDIDELRAEVRALSAALALR